MKYNIDYFLKRANEIHNNIYDYSFVKYLNWKSKVKIKCNRCGVTFEQSPQSHINRKCGCRRCNKHKLSQNEVIHRANKIHNNIYDYSLVRYIRYDIMVDIVCSIHGIFEMTMENHVNNRKICPSCKLYNDEDERRNREVIFIETAKLIHNNKYIYDDVYYKNYDSYIKIICHRHGKFEQLAGSHIRGHGCVKCRDEYYSILYTKSNSAFIEDAKLKHIDKYIYDKTIYEKADINVIITCRKHGDFEQLPNNHLQGSGCPVCKLSKGEERVRCFLVNNNLKFISQKTFSGCKSPNGFLLKFDFYLSELNICIEYDGRQHFEPVGFGSKEIEIGDKFKNTQLNDSIKNKYCIDNNISLIRIPYYEYKNINGILTDLINQHGYPSIYELSNF